MDLTTGIFAVVIIIFSAIIHEVMHGVAAEWLGDKTARYAGRITLNPIPHIDPFGSVLLPLIFTLTNSPILFGWAKPVPYNPYNLKPGRFSEAIVAGAGPATNLAIALFAGIVIRSGLLASATQALMLIVIINVMLCIFNLIPIPPLDGSKVVEVLLPRRLSYRYHQWRHRMEHNPFMGMGIILVIVLFLGGAFGALIYSIASLIAGI